MRSAPSRVAAVAARMAGRSLAVTDHGLGGGGWWGMLPRLFDRFLVVSRFSAATLGAPPDRTAVVYGGADPARYHPPARGEEREGVLFVGRLTPHKGVDLLIRAVPRDVPLTVVGTRGHDPRPPESGYPELLALLARGRRVRFVTRADDAEVAAQCLRCTRLAERHDLAALRAFHALDGAFSRWSGQPRDELQGFAYLLCRQPRIGRQRTQHRFPSFRRDSGPSVATVLERQFTTIRPPQDYLVM